MTADILHTRQEGRVLELAFHRPDHLNAMNDALYDATALALQRANADSCVAVVILSGEGRAFCAGQDLGELAKRPTYAAGETHGFTPFMDALNTFSKPLAAAVNGLGVGIGLTMLPYCDFVAIDETARLRAPFVTLGVTAEAGSTLLLPARVGWSNAADILFSGRWIAATEAVAMGLATVTTPSGQTLLRAREWAEPIARNPVDSVVATKTLLLEARRQALLDARARETVAFARLEGGPANLEALAAFREKRKPDFSKL
jgi:enoyl-CoA hydratase/carnithine racemase